MDYKVTVIIRGAKDPDQAKNAVDEMLDAYDFHGRKVEENPEDEILIDLPLPGELENAEELT